MAIEQSLLTTLQESGVTAIDQLVANKVRSWVEGEDRVEYISPERIAAAIAKLSDPAVREALNPMTSPMHQPWF